MPTKIRRCEVTMEGEGVEADVTISADLVWEHPCRLFRERVDLIVRKFTKGLTSEETARLDEISAVIRETEL